MIIMETLEELTNTEKENKINMSELEKFKQVSNLVDKILHPTCLCGCKEFYIITETMECGSIYEVRVCKNCGRKY